VTIEPEFSLDQPRQINHLAPDGVLAKDRIAFRDGDPLGRSARRVLVVITAFALTLLRPFAVMAAVSRYGCRFGGSTQARDDICP